MEEYSIHIQETMKAIQSYGINEDTCKLTCDIIEIFTMVKCAKITC